MSDAFPDFDRKQNGGETPLIACRGYHRHHTALVSPDAKIGRGTRIWAFCNVLAGAVIGRDCNICDHCFIENGAVIGDEVTVKNSVAVFKGVRLESKVFVGSHVGFTNDRRPRSRRPDWTCQPTLVKEGASLGSHAVIVAGVTIGRWAMVGAGSVVTRDVPDFALVTGVPARVAGYVCVCGRSLSAAFFCEACRLRFEKKDGVLTPM